MTRAELLQALTRLATGPGPNESARLMFRIVEGWDALAGAAPAPTAPPPRGPICRCGCTWVEHALYVLADHDGWYREGGQCLSCGRCERFAAAGVA